MQQAVDIAIPAITFLLLTAVGLDLTRDDFGRVRRQPLVVLTGVMAPLAVLPLVALGIVAAFSPAPAMRTGLLLIAASPIGGISNTYSYLARASTALSVTLTGVSCLLAVVTIPLIARVFEAALGEALGFTAPAGALVLQLSLMLALPVGLGMWVRHRWPTFANAHQPLVQRLAFGSLALLIAFVIWAEFRSFATTVRSAVPMSAVFVAASMAFGWTIGSILRVSPRDRFTLAVEFSTRNVAVATAVAVTLLGRVDFAVFATIYLLTEIPIMLVAIGAFRSASRDPRRF
ncbi:MAG: hypothetical protein AB1806_05380 [Acidobacteriota bacterium]